MNRTRLSISNYEEWFIDHIDGNLNEQEEEQLKVFLLANPEIAKEMEGIDGLQLMADELSYPEKSELMVPSEEDLKLMFLAEEDSLASLQDLSPSERITVQSWRRTVLHADTSILYQGKSELLQRESTPIIPIWLSRIAIAASVTGVISLIFFNSTDLKYIPRGPIAQENPQSLDDILTADHNDFAPFLEKETENNMILTPDLSRPKSTSDEKRFAQEQEIEQSPTPVQEAEEHFAIEEDSTLFELEEEPQPLFTEAEQSIDEENREHGQIDESMASIDNSSESGQTNSTKEYNSIFSFLKDQVLRTAEDKELLAMDDISEEDKYIKTSFRLGGFEISRSKRRK